MNDVTKLTPPPVASIAKLWSDPDTPATFGGLLATTFRRLLVQKKIDTETFYAAVDEEVASDEPGRRYAMNRSNLIKRLTGATMTVETFQQGLRLFAVSELALDAKLVFYGDEHGEEHDITATYSIMKGDR